MALCIPAVGESYDCAKAAISLQRSNSFPWPEDCVQIHQTLFPRRRWPGSGHETKQLVTKFRLEDWILFSLNWNLAGTEPVPGNVKVVIAHALAVSELHRRRQHRRY